MNPLVSVIIPTHNRPQFLPRAVESALVGMPSGSVEVIVVPNGPDESWKESLRPFHNNKNVRILPIQEANGNIARNTGLAASRGEFVRFLDDDDYLIPEGARKQYEMLQKHNVDLVCGGIKSVMPDGKVIRSYTPIDHDDFCLAVASTNGLYLPHAYVYRKERLGGVNWDTEITNRQDLYWLVELVSSREMTWKRSNDIVGVWQHHWNHRITLAHSKHIFHLKEAQAMIALYDDLVTSRRINHDRKQAIAENLWGNVHSAFHLNTRYWGEIAQKARVIDPDSRPVQPVYNWPILRYFDPLIMQWLLLPKRHLSYLKRKLYIKLKHERSW